MNIPIAKVASLFFGLVLIMICLPSCQPKDDHEDIEGRINRVESGLLPSFTIDGREVTMWTIAERMEHHNVPGLSIAFFDQGEIQWTRSYGYTSSDSLKHVDELTMFQAASISKPVATMGAMTLVENGQLDLDRPVNEYLDGWEVPQNEFTENIPITFRHLVTHTGGLTVHGFRGYAEGEDVPSTIQVLDGDEPANSAAVVTDTFPEAIWRYSGGGYTISQKVITDITGQTFTRFMDEALIRPMGLSRSTYSQPLDSSFHSNAAIGHRGNGNQVDGRWHTYPEQAAAGLWTTPSDLARISIAIQKAYLGDQDQLLTAETTRAMLTKHLGDWGLGFSLRGEADSLMFGHGGANEGFRCNLTAFAELGQGVAIMTNSDNGGSLAAEILRSIDAEYKWGTYEAEIKRIIDLNQESLVKFEGKYVVQGGPSFAIQLTMVEGTIEAHQLWNDVKYELYAQDSLTFFSSDDGTQFTFNKGEDGSTNSISVNGFKLIREE